MQKVLAVLLMLLMIGIFLFSAQPADDSTITSSHICTIAAGILLQGFEKLEADTQKQIVEGLSFVVRKAAHFTEYAVLGFLLYLLLRRKPWNFLIAFTGTALYAATDEFHQIFVPGRSGQIRDVLIDSAGGAAGILAAFFLLCIIHCCTHREIVSKGAWLLPSGD